MIKELLNGNLAHFCDNCKKNLTKLPYEEQAKHVRGCKTKDRNCLT